MADEARAMLDALMGQDRNAALPPSSSNGRGGGGGTDWESMQARKTKSCYDPDVCPLYCAWGTDVFELFTNTKSDIGPNPYTVRDDAREEFLSLPEHEKDRLGFERMLHRKLGDLVRSCDRIVSRNKEKLRQEIAAAAKSRTGSGTSKIDPVTDVSEEMMAEAVDMMADLEIREDEVKAMLGDIMKIDQEWKGLWKELQLLERGEQEQQEQQEQQQEQMMIPPPVPVDVDVDVDVDPPQDEADPEESAKDSSAKPEASNDAVGDESKNNGTDPNTANKTEDDEQKKEDTEAKIKEIRSKLYKLSSEQQQIIGSIANLTTQVIVPLRDSLQTLTKQLYYVKTDISADKTVCEVSGNFMSSRDAEERIAAHYAGKQYVGWKLVREKFKELDQKFRNSVSRGGGPGPQQGRYGGGGPRGGYGGYGGGGSRGGGYYDNGRDRDRGRYNDRGGGGGGYGHGYRSRSRDGGGGGGGGGYRRGGRDGGGHRGWRWTEPIEKSQNESR